MLPTNPPPEFLNAFEKVAPKGIKHADNLITQFKGVGCQEGELLNSET
jgi:hypothetical protein